MFVWGMHPNWHNSEKEDRFLKQKLIVVVLVMSCSIHGMDCFCDTLQIGFSTVSDNSLASDVDHIHKLVQIYILCK